MTERPAQQLLPDGVYATFNYSCNVCGGTVSVQNSMRQPHTCGGDGIPALDLPAIRALHAEQPKGEWAALTDPGDRKTAPAWIVGAGDIEVRLPATYEAGRLAAFIAAAPSIVAQLVAAVERVEGLAAEWEGMAKGSTQYDYALRACAYKVRAALKEGA